MNRRSVEGAGAPMSTAAMGRLLTRLRRAAVDGVVPEREFLEGVRALGVGDPARDRMRGELARLGLRVGNMHMHAGDDSGQGEKVVRRSEKGVNPRVARARVLLARYADADGCVSSRAVEGVVRLAGLNSKEAAELLAGANVRSGVGGATTGYSEPSRVFGKSAKGAPAAAAGDGRASVMRQPSKSNEAHGAVAAATRDEAAVAADWGRALRVAKEPPSQAWLAEYALAAVGRRELTELIGQPACEAALRIARDREPADHSILAVLEMLRRVWDRVAAAGLRPEDFLDRPAVALRGATPRTYLASTPLVHDEARVVLREVLREFAAAAPLRKEPVRGMEGAQETPGTTDTKEAQRSDADPRPAVTTRGVTSSGSGAPAAEPAPIAVSAEPLRDETAAQDRDQRTDVARRAQFTADWSKAKVLVRPSLGGDVAWLAEYALLAVGRLQLGAVLGSSAADAVVRAARQQGMLNRNVIKALEVLETVFDTVKDLGVRPEHFFEWPADALRGVTPRAYLTERPLIRHESRLAVSDALREFVDAQTRRNTPVSKADEAGGSQESRSHEEGASVRRFTDADQRLAEARTRHEAELARLGREHEDRLAEERKAADERLAGFRAEAERNIAALEEALLDRADRAAERREQHVRNQADERLERLKKEHHEAYQALLRRTEYAEEAARRAEGTGEQIHVLERRLREYREGAEARIADLESRLGSAQATVVEGERVARARVAELETRLREAEAALAQQGQVVETTRRRSEEAEQQAAQRLAQSQHEAWIRMSELQARLADAQTQLAVAQAASQSRSSLRDRWRRS
ncbi:hypothetical protein [Streptomyces sp. yara]|uniref:hypothetical protein n=1 Tax=Streptomyces sp. yara TaxID=3458421 RepID=UPI00404013CE